MNGVLIHVEVQGYPDREFPERMFVYHYRIYDRYRRDIVSLAVLTDPDPSFRPSAYCRSLLGCELAFRFPMVKLIDYDARKLETSAGPFALVTRIHLEYLAAGADPARRFNARVSLTRRLYRQGFARDQVIRLYRFMGYLMRLPDDLAVQYKKEIESIEGELNMPYITDTERLARRQGQAEGQLQGLREAVTEALQARFGDIPYALREAVSRITDDKELKRLHRLAITARSLADFAV